MAEGAGDAGERIRIALTVAQREEMARGRFVRVTLPRAIEIAGARTRSVLVGRVEGSLRAYANVCRHQAVPLDLGMDTAMSSDGHHLVCHQHGAMYRPDDGECIYGPCKGERLSTMTILSIDEEICELELSHAKPRD